MKKKILSALLAAAMSVTLLAGCGGGDNGSNAGNNAGGNTADEGSAGGDVSDAGAIDMDEDPYTVAIQLVILPGADFSAQESDMEAALSAITLPAINCNVDIQFVSIAEVANTTSLAVAGNEKIDLVHVATVSPLSSMVGADLLYDMNTDNLLQTRGKDLIALFGDLMKSGEVNGQQLAVPAKLFNAMSIGLGFNKTMLDSLGISVPETGTIDDAERILYEFKEKKAGTEYEDVMPYYVGQGNMNLMMFIYSYTSFGNESSYGVVFDETADSIKVENVYASDLFRQHMLRMYKWRQDGILMKDSTDQTSAQDYCGAQQLLTQTASYNPQLMANYDTQAALNGFEWARMITAPAMVANSYVTEYMWGIAANSERPDKAMDLLNFLYTNGDAANIIKYGLEGSNYDFVNGSDHIVAINGSYLPLFVEIGDPNTMYIQDPNDDTYMDKWHEMMSSAVESKLIGYMFDDSAFQTESSVISSVILEYLPNLQNGMYGSEAETNAKIDEFIAALESAGINDVIAANQEQIDAFLASK